MQEKINSLAKEFLDKSKDKEVQIVSHFDTDGITSAAIMIKTLKKLDRKFSVKIVKTLEEQFIHNLAKDKLTIFLDLSSGSLNHIRDAEIKEVFIIDHHEVIQEIPANVKIINPELHNKQKISGSGLTYLFCKQLTPIKECAKLAILGMIGDMLDKEIGKLNNGILEDGEIKRKRGLMIYPSTRPLNRTLEFCSNPYIPDVTGNIKGVLELLREIKLDTKSGKYPSLMELNEEEMEKLVTAIMLRNPKAKNNQIIGDIFLVKFFNKLEDGRELSATVNACSRLGESEIALQFCLEIPKAKKRAQTIHAKYRQQIVSGLKFARETEKIEGKGFVILNAKDKIKDTIVGVIASILSHSALYEEGTVIVALAHYEDKIKVSARNVGSTGRNVREILNRIVEQTTGEVGGHEFAAGCTISQEQEQNFLDLLKKNLELEVVKI